ncbi:uncharacterized protein LOC18775484 isoform X2 [Prunus persica]|uniref:uncharacterized protein LOC18775484 isoform X2 n=1 Tax=Prunus persica TaxID=3760 RepID=UPI0009AB34CF|nr:uncharacterized protein LOC18775484 isoform X2 [Prunus persica]
MLQWMGGSRRKVATSRKSTQQRQKQYFEQRRRQQQHQGQTTGLETYADGINISGQHHKEHRSLDILSFLNLSTTAQEHKSACPNRREDVEVNASRMKYDITKDPPTIPPKMVAPLNSVEFNQARAESGFREEIASPKKVMPNHNKSFNELNSQPDNCRTDTDQLVDFFGDDGLNDYVEGSPVQEAHVAFSVEGLGKVGMETPVHSPKQPARTFTYDCSSPLNAARQPKSFKNHKNLDDFETEMDAMMQDINMPRCSSGLEFSTNSMDSFGYSKQKLSRHDGHSGKLDSYYGSRRIFDHAENCSKDKWDGRRCFQDETSFIEWEHDLSWKRPSEMNCDSVDNFMHRTYKTPDFTFEGPFSPLRSATDITDKFDILGAPSYSKHQRSEYDHDFMISNGARHHTVGRSFDFGGATNQPDWSCFVTDERDNLSLLSEESCSSSAVRVNAIDNSLSKSTRNRSKRRHDNAYAGPDYHANVTSTGKTHDKSRHDVHPENIAHGSGKCTKMSNSSKLKPSHYSNSPFDEKLNPNSNWFTEERYMSVNINSVCSSFHQKSDTNCPSAGSKLLFGDPFSASPVPELHLDPRSPSKHSEPVASSPSGSFITEKFEFHDSPKTSKIGVGSTKTELFRYSPGNTPSPDLSAQESVSKVEGRKAESQRSEEFKLEEESCIMDNGLFTENNDEMGALTSKSKNSEFKEAKDAAPGLKASVKSTYFPDHAEKASSSLKTLGKFESKIDGKEYVVQTFKDHHGYEIPLPCQHRTKEMEDAEPQERKKETKQQGDFVDSSCRVMMLQSYVQFLCVQKVLKEAAAQTGIKKK